MNILKYSLTYFFILLAVFLGQAVDVCAQNNAKQVTLMTYNIQGHSILNSRQLEKTATVINSASPDVVAVQEVDQRFVKDCAELLGTKTGMKSRFLITHGSYYGIVLLSKEEPLGVKTHLIPRGAGGGSDKADPDENRGVIIAEFPDYYFLSTHYSLNANDRDVATAYIIDFAKGVDKPVFLGGDLNVKETYRAMVTFKNNGFTILNDTKQPTYPSTAPADCIDYILGYNKSSSTYQVVERGIANQSDIDLAAISDHLPVYVKLEFSTPSAIDKEEVSPVCLTKTSQGYRINGVVGEAIVKLYSTTGQLLVNTLIQDNGELLLSNNDTAGVSVLWLKTANRVYTYKLIF